MNEPLIVDHGDPNKASAFAGSDPLLGPFLRATDQPVAESILTQLIQQHADPIIAKILKSKLRVSLNGAQGNHENQDALEIASDLRATLIADLRAAQQRPAQPSVRSFVDYVAIKTYSACADYFREKNPRRWRLKNLLRYHLRQNPRFALWPAENKRSFAGLSEWCGTTTADGSSPSLPSPSTVRQMLSRQQPLEMEPAELLSAIFESVGHAVEFDRVVTLAAEAWNITDAPSESLDDPERVTEREAASSAPRVDLLLEQRLYLETLWLEVRELPALQRAALLLNLRDAQGGSAIFFIPHLGIATQAVIAEVLELPQAEFAAIWNDLPLDDARIAEMFGVTRQQVINLRKTARERLWRRMEKTQRG